MRWSEPRKGFTLVMMLFMMVVFIGCAAFAIDTGLMNLYHAQLSNAADASAIAAAHALGTGATTTSVDSAQRYAGLNKVGKQNNTLAAGDVEPGTWTQAGGFVATGSWVTGAPFAVRTTTRYTGSYLFARLFGFTSKNLTVTAVAVRGSVGSDTCARPWAIPYQELLDKIHTPGSKNAKTYDLKASDVAALNGLGAASDGAVTFEGVKFPPGRYADGTTATPWPGGSNYRDAQGESCADLAAHLAAWTTNPYISAGDWLEAESGTKTGPTKQGVADWCARYGCPGRVVVAIYDSSGTVSNCSGCWHVKYMSEFMLTGYDNSAKSPTGYFVEANNSGPFTPKPGPISKNALVQ